MTDIGELGGQTVGPYELRELLGRGNMTAVYRAYQHAKRREVAVKVMQENLTGATGYLERFSAGARAAVSLDHPHIVPFYDYGTQTGLSYVVTRYLTGGSLQERIDHASSRNRPRASLSEIAELLSQIASALDYAHLKAIYHDGIRPHNILFDNRGNAYVADFGIAWLLRQMTPIPDGLAYMAPERWRTLQASAAADQYGLAVTAYQLVAGRLPFEGGNDQQLMYEHLNEPPPSLAGTRPELPEAVSLVLERALSKNPSERFRSNTQFAQAFKSAIEGVGGESTNFFVFKLPKRERRPVKLAAPEPTGDPPEAKPAEPASPAPAFVVKPKTVRAKAATKPAVTKPMQKKSRPAPEALAPAPVEPPPMPPELHIVPALSRRVPRREYVLGMIAVALLTLTMIAALIASGDLGPENAARDPALTAESGATRVPAVVLLPTDMPMETQPPAVPEIGIEAMQVGINTVQFRAVPDDGLSGVVWDFGDGTTAGEAAPIHEYAAPGTYNIRLTAAGPAGNEVVSAAEIEVAEGCILTPKRSEAELYAAPVTIHVIMTLGIIPEGSEVFTADSQRGRDGFIWYRVTHDGVAGWVHSSAVRAVDGRCP
jgi:eukaryotic-like serine/threonine-protein kinase